jgi:hypothetical protein
MRDKSIFEGIKELGDFRFIDQGNMWDVYKQSGSGYYLFTRISKKKESNISLYNRVKSVDYF